MEILKALRQLRDDLKTWVTNNLRILDAKIDEKTILIDDELDVTSVNPVQNKIITTEIADINSRVGNASVASQISNAISQQPHFSGDYNDLINAPNIMEDDNGEMVITDDVGNIIFKINEDGIHTTDVTLNGESVIDKLSSFREHIDSDIHVTLSDKANWNNKVDNVDGKGLSSNDFTDEYKQSLDNLSNMTFDESDPTVPAWAKEPTKPTYTAEEIGLGNVNNTSDADKPVSTATQNAINALRSDINDLIDTKVASLVDSAPDTLDTLNELAAALGDDPNFATTVTTEIGKKVDKETGKGLSTNDFTDEYKDTLDNLSNMTFNEVDPTVPAWAKNATKPSYTASEVGALSDTTVLADLVTDTNHRTVTDAEKESWNAKSNFSGDYRDLINVPEIDEDESGDYIIADSDGNIVFRINEYGTETTQLTTDTLIVDGTDVVEAISQKLNSSDLTVAINDALTIAKESGEFNGDDGYTPIRGTDFWTEDDKNEMKAYIRSYIEEVILGGEW